MAVGHSHACVAGSLVHWGVRVGRLAGRLIVVGDPCVMSANMLTETPPLPRVVSACGGVLWALASSHVPYLGEHAAVL